jgi:hypothetical protein
MLRKSGRTGLMTACVCIFAFFMLAAAAPRKTKVLDKWFCLVRDSKGIVIEYKKTHPHKGIARDTCSAVWFNDRRGYKLYLKNGDSVHVCGTCVTGSRFLSAEKGRNSQPKSKKPDKSEKGRKKGKKK